jgi:AraC-like DNA-binding protein
MIREYTNSDIGATFLLASAFEPDVANRDKYFMFIWNDGDQSVNLILDDRSVILEPDTITCTTYLNKVQIDNDSNNLKTLLFNREFYCVHTYDSEVSCNGLLFFGSDTSPILKLDKVETERLRTLFSVLNEEFAIRDANQEEMLRILLKRFIIRCTRLARVQLLKSNENQSDIDLVRTFNVLVEEHFRTKKSVSDYAKMMYKSPKTLANVFGKYSEDSPLQIIHKRVVMEAKRMLLYTDKTAKEIGYELGYPDPAQFSKLFKNFTGMTTTVFREKKAEIP